MIFGLGSCIIIGGFFMSLMSLSMIFWLMIFSICGSVDLTSWMVPFGSVVNVFFAVCVKACISLRRFADGSVMEMSFLVEKVFLPGLTMSWLRSIYFEPRSSIVGLLRRVQEVGVL